MAVGKRERERGTETERWNSKNLKFKNVWINPWYCVSGCQKQTYANSFNLSYINFVIIIEKKLLHRDGIYLNELTAIRYCYERHWIRRPCRVVLKSTSERNSSICNVLYQGKTLFLIWCWEINPRCCTCLAN